MKKTAISAADYHKNWVIKNISQAELFILKTGLDVYHFKTKNI